MDYLDIEKRTSWAGAMVASSVLIAINHPERLNK
jgi:hypothetical protein